MSFYTYYKYDGAINHCSKNRLEDEHASAIRTIAYIKKDLTMLAISAPPATGVINVGDGEELWGDYVNRRLTDLFNDWEESQYRAFVTEQALEVQREHPEDVTDDSDCINEEG